MGIYDIENILTYAQQLKADEIFIAIGEIPSMVVRNHREYRINIRNSQGLVSTISHDEYSNFVKQIRKISGVDAIKDFFECTICIGTNAFFKITTRLDEKGHALMLAQRFS